jgi:3-dehydroquinate synthase
LKTIQVNTKSKKYSVYLGGNSLKPLPELFTRQQLPERVLVVMDKTVDKIYGQSIKRIINSFAEKKYFLTLTASEKIKSISTATQIYQKLIDQKFGKDTVLISIGGGTIGDLAGYVASTYTRGIKLVHIPTTLLSAVDSSIGGKTGVNFQSAKNIIGTIYQPEFVLIDSKFMSTLPKQELVSGFGEVIKYSYLTDKKFYKSLLKNYKLLFENDADFFNKIIFECIKIKAAIVSSDETEETGLRKILNFGHTFAHSIESNSDYKMPHGNAVIAGIVSALHLSSEMKMINNNQLNYMLELPMKFKSSIRLKRNNSDEIYKKMVYDKKNRNGEIRFVLLKDFGELIIDIPAERKDVIKSLKRTEQIWFKRATAGL